MNAYTRDSATEGQTLSLRTSLALRSMRCLTLIYHPYIYIPFLVYSSPSAQRPRHDVAIIIPRARAPVNANCDGIVMVLPPSILLVSYIVAVSGQLQGTKNAFGHQVRSQKESYTTSWAVEITDGGETMANIVAERCGFKNLGKLEVARSMSKT